MPTSTSTVLLAPPEKAVSCYFCGGHIEDPGAGFLDHVALRVACRDRHESWMAHIDEDRPGG